MYNEAELSRHLFDQIMEKSLWGLLGEHETTARVMRTRRPNPASHRLCGWGRALLLVVVDPKPSVASPLMRTSYRSLAEAPEQERLQKGVWGTAACHSVEL